MRNILKIAGFSSLALLAGVALWPADSVSAQRAAGAATNYASQVTIGAGGSHIQGNPNARVKLVEYVSYTCPHCANYTAESSSPLTSRFVTPGTVSVEIRHVVRDPIDLAMTVAVNCGSSSRFFSRHSSMMANQTQILTRVRALPRATIEGWQNAPEGQRLRRVADDSGVTAWMRTRGFTAAQINSCLADEALQERLVAMTNGATAAGVTGTPSFGINGRLDTANGIHDWTNLSGLLTRSIAQN